MSENGKGKADLVRLIEAPSVEISPGDGQGVQLIAAALRPGTLVHVTALPNETPARIVETSIALARGGLVPVPHIAARSLASVQALDGLLERAAADAGVNRILLVGGDVDRPRGPFSSSLDVLKSGLLQKHGIASVALAGHPEGHPTVPAACMSQALLDKVAFARAEGLSVRIITQLCFEAEPILGWLDRLRQDGVDAPARIGVAGPTSPQAMLRFALRCGVGNSVRTLRRRADTIGRLLADATPDELLQKISETFPESVMNGVEGVHFFVFGGIRKMTNWFQDFEAQIQRPGVHSG